MNKKGLKIFALFIGVASLLILGSVDWRLPIGIFLFGWAMNLDEMIKSKQPLNL